MRQRWTIAHSPFFLTQTAMGSIMPPQSAALSPGSISTCRLERQFGQWFLCSLPAPAALPCVRTPCKQKLRCRRGSCNNLFRTVCVCFRDSFFLPGIELREDGRVCFICRPPGQRTLSDDFVINFKQNLLVFLFKKRSDDRYPAHCEIKAYLPKSFLKRLIIAPYQPNNQLKWYLAKP